MRRKLVKTGSSLAVTLPAEIVDSFGLEKGQDVDLTIHPSTGAITIRLGVREFEGGRTTRRFRDLVDELVKERAALYRALAK
ncbi:MAG: AbrB/MazE/SpoVT family DNA-binding domain-containing protein [Acidobacteria bacterium]|nr:AbrB/MazE/SpoVT family DNA-binding domain-containing protein [Acidobacteriota bacterium]